MSLKLLKRYQLLFLSWDINVWPILRVKTKARCLDLFKYSEMTKRKKNIMKTLSTLFYECFNRYKISSTETNFYITASEIKIPRLPGTINPTLTKHRNTLTLNSGVLNGLPVPVSPQAAIPRSPPWGPPARPPNSLPFALPNFAFLIEFADTKFASEDGQSAPATATALPLFLKHRKQQGGQKQARFFCLCCLWTYHEARVEKTPRISSAMPNTSTTSGNRVARL